ncbi:ABC transporter permease [Ruegeria hyattellae]|uniref:ABC transporter permease n=1 Tax=Ruegeria hyattellae TaxID=3233337 RepID=UPI00355BAD5C
MRTESTGYTKTKPANPVLSVVAKFLQNYWGILLVLGLWEAVVIGRQLNSIVLPTPEDVVLAVIQNPILYLTNFLSTAWVALVGLAIGAVIGTTLAIISWSSRILSGVLTPLGLMFASIPVVAIIPILARLLGYETKTVLAIVSILSFFPFFVYTSTGLRMLPPGGHDLVSVIGTSRLRYLRHLSLPAALPSWCTAMRLAGPNAVLAAMVAEFLMATPGLGTLLSQASEDLNKAVALGASLVATVVSVMLFHLAQHLEKRVHAAWK